MDEPPFLGIINTTWKGNQAYNPGDLFLAHPTKEYTYKMFGRSSDQILLATGETVRLSLHRVDILMSLLQINPCDIGELFLHSTAQCSYTGKT